MATVIREMVATLGFDIDTEAIDDLERSMGSLTRVAGLLAGAVAGSAAAIWGWTNAAAGAGNESAKSARMIGVTSEAYQELSYAAKQSGISTEEMREGIINLNKAVDGAASGNDALLSTFRDLNVNFSDFQALEPDKQFEAIGDSLSNITDPARRVAASIQLLGGSGAKFASLFENGSASIQEMREEAIALGLVMSSADTLAAEQFSTQVDRVKGVLLGLRNTIGMELVPIVNEYVDSLLAWFQANREIIQDRLGAVLRTMVYLVTSTTKAVVGLVRWVNILADALGGWNRILQMIRIVLIGIIGYQALSGLTAMVKIIRTMVVAWRAVGMAAMWANIKMMAIPLAIGAAIAVLVLFVQDFMTFLRGGDSLIGRFVERFREAGGFFGYIAGLLLDWKKILLDLPGVWQDVVGWFRSIWDGFVKFFADAWEATTKGFSEAWEATKQVFVEVIDWIGSRLDAGVTFFRDLFTSLADSISSGLSSAFETVWGVARSIFGRIANLVTGVADTILSVAQAGGRLVGMDVSSLEGLRERVSAMQASVTSNHAAGIATARDGASRGDLSVNAGGVNVTIQGSTNMGPREVQAATARGTAFGLQTAINQADRTLAGGQR